MNDKVAEGVEDVKRDDMNRVIRGGVDGESDSVEAVVLKWNHEIFGGVPFATFIEFVFRDERRWVPDAVCAKYKRDDHRREVLPVLLTLTFYL